MHLHQLSSYSLAVLVLLSQQDLWDLIFLGGLFHPVDSRKRQNTFQWFSDKYKIIFTSVERNDFIGSSSKLELFCDS